MAMFKTTSHGPTVQLFLCPNILSGMFFKGDLKTLQNTVGDSI